MQSKVPQSAAKDTSASTEPSVPAPSASSNTNATTADPSAISLVDEMLQLVKVRSVNAVERPWL